MNCLLVAATISEIAPFLEHYRESQKRWHIDLELDVLVTGIGLVATTYQLSRQIAVRRPDLVVQAGLAGCFDPSVSLAKVVTIKKDAIADEMVIESDNLRTLFDLKLVPASQRPYKNGWLVNPDTGMLKRSRLKLANGVSVNQVSTSSQLIKLYKKKFNPLTESMEGAALHYVCLMEKIPFLQLRSLSNYVGERNKKKWKMKEAIQNLNKELIRLLENL